MQSRTATELYSNRAVQQLNCDLQSSEAQVWGTWQLVSCNVDNRGVRWLSGSGAAEAARLASGGCRGLGSLESASAAAPAATAWHSYVGVQLEVNSCRRGMAAAVMCCYGCWGVFPEDATRTDPFCKLWWETAPFPKRLP